MVMGGDSCSEGCEFKSLHCILDGHFSHIFVEKNVMCVTKTKINKKEAGVGPFYYYKNSSKFHLNQKQRGKDRIRTHPIVRTFSKTFLYFKVFASFCFCLF